MSAVKKDFEGGSRIFVVSLLFLVFGKAKSRAIFI